jgi:xanthine dehydrogenase accessory factor
VSLDRAALAAAVARHGPVVRVVVAEVQGSAPREVGASMLVWDGGQSGTIGGGALEYDAARDAREMLARGDARRFRKALLGPDLGQCCGGAVALLSEVWSADALEALAEVHARPVTGTADAAPLGLRRLLAEARRGTGQLGATLVEGWFVEPVTPAATSVWIWGAGHVGRALVDTLAPLPDLALTWIDTAPDRFPAELPEGVTALPAPEIAAAVALAPAQAHHLVLTYSHALDLALCDVLLRHGFATTGLIGSTTKWARFRSRLGQMGHADAAIARIQCPIGAKGLGKHPQAIAVGVAYGLLMGLAKKEATGPAPRKQGDGDDGRALDA